MFTSALVTSRHSRPSSLTTRRQEKIARCSLPPCVLYEMSCELLAAMLDRWLMPADNFNSNEGMLAYVRETGTSLHHPVGTCRMGSDDRAVVDPQLRVRWVDRLHVINASTMPQTVSWSQPCRFRGQSIGTKVSRPADQDAHVGKSHRRTCHRQRGRV